jgi:hypothetical protein
LREPMREPICTEPIQSSLRPAERGRNSRRVDFISTAPNDDGFHEPACMVMCAGGSFALRRGGYKIRSTRVTACATSPPIRFEDTGYAHPIIRISTITTSVRNISIGIVVG